MLKGQQVLTSLKDKIHKTDDTTPNLEATSVG